MKTTAESLMRAKLDLLANLVECTRDRGCGIDYLAPRAELEGGGVLIKSRIQLGMDPNAGTEDQIFENGGLFLVEHTLLRFAGPAADLGYEFSATVVVCVPQDLGGNPSYREFAERVTRENLPAHVVARTRFVESEHDFEHFLFAYRSWREALENRFAPGSPDHLAEASAMLARWLRQEIS